MGNDSGLLKFISDFYTHSEWAAEGPVPVGVRVDELGLPSEARPMMA